MAFYVLDLPEGEKMKLKEIQAASKVSYEAFKAMDTKTQQDVIATLERERSVAGKGVRSQPKARSQDVRRTTEHVHKEVCHSNSYSF